MPPAVPYSVKSSACRHHGGKKNIDRKAFGFVKPSLFIKIRGKNAEKMIFIVLERGGMAKFMPQKNRP